VASAYTFNYADVGEVELFVRNAAATAQKGTSGRFVVRPAGFALSEIKPTANPAGRCAVATTPAPALACANTAADAATFVRAGEDFSVTVTALTAGGVAAPNFGRETVPESVRLVPANAVAGMVSPPAVQGNFGAFTAGAASGTAFTWGEVGVITLTPQVADGDYLGAGNVSGSASANVGRFIPDHFATEVTQACVAGAFTYSGQPFTVRVTARNLAGGTTLNYAGSAVPAASFARATTLSDAGSTSNFSGNLVAALDFAAGVAVNNTVSYTFAAAQTAPATLTVRAQDSDGVVSGAVEGTASIRSGRARLLNAYGAELLDLPVSFALDYWDGNAWVKNGSDSCTVLTSSNFAFAFPTGTPGRPNNLAACETALTVSGSPPDYVLSLRRPGAGNSGWTDMVLNLGSTALGAAHTQCTALGGPGPAEVPANLPWLQFDWLGAGNANPGARATFGIYRSPLIYRRENY
jgi:MSHA biogenesis protein MshQ